MPDTRSLTLPDNLGAFSAALRHSDQTAFITPLADGAQKEITFRQLNHQADAICLGLRQFGWSGGTRVAILARNSIDYIASLLGIMRAGLVAVPINFRFPTHTIERILADSGSRLLLGDEDQLTRISGDLPRLSFGAELDALQRQGEAICFAPGADDLALMLYTSGSTGMPKGVRLTHASHRWVVATRLSTRELTGERVLIAAPFYHMNALALALLTLASQVTTVLLPQFAARAYLQAVNHYRCSWLTAVPPMLAMMLQEKDLLAESDLSCVRVIRMGSAPVSDSLYRSLRRWLPQARIINAYGTTEAGPVVFAPHPQGLTTPAGSPGYPHPAVSVRLRGADGALADEGVLEMKSPALMHGYHQRPDVPAPFTDDGYYITGDVFRRDEQGFFWFIGRHDDMFVCGGENIWPGEVEKLLESHPQVQQACVVPVADDIKGQKPVAWVIPRAGESLDPQALKNWALQQGPAYLHPRHIWLTDHFPLAGTNKVDRRALQISAEQRVQQGERP
ncbi:acyl--CoA ligase [Affinibrenneria salicis]|uniref:Acyl--CoA ligase n=1 Tax=Affinibrenneria salicis TaxID=2590031 RepID=A0A5J5G6R5_9GAMM|nr:class I adenylate-forming enzyme family protein [Affinibrenneria salicis]KAA9002713.1 acyl--CoA ligase [Affinibrenneria salicis]KAA9003000.1 acyl--CoA ligase [Affinibrenneria salicis]